MDSGCDRAARVETERTEITAANGATGRRRITESPFSPLRRSLRLMPASPSTRLSPLDRSMLIEILPSHCCVVMMTPAERVQWREGLLHRGDQRDGDAIQD